MHDFPKSSQSRLECTRFFLAWAEAIVVVVVGFVVGVYLM